MQQFLPSGRMHEMINALLIHALSLSLFPSAFSHKDTQCTADHVCRLYIGIDIFSRGSYLAFVGSSAYVPLALQHRAIHLL